MDKNTNIVQLRQTTSNHESSSDIEKLLSIRNLILRLDDDTSRVRMLRALSHCLKQEAINGINH